MFCTRLNDFYFEEWKWKDSKCYWNKKADRTLSHSPPSTCTYICTNFEWKKQDLTVCCMSSHLGFLITGAPISPSYWTHTVRELDRGGGGKDSMHVCVFFLYQFSPQNKISNHSSCSTPKYLHLSPTRYLSQSYLFIPASFTCLQPCWHSLILSHSIDEGLLFIQEREKENDRIAVKSAIKIYNFERWKWQGSKCYWMN